MLICNCCVMVVKKGEILSELLLNHFVQSNSFPALELIKKGLAGLTFPMCTCCIPARRFSKQGETSFCKLYRRAIEADGKKPRTDSGKTSKDNGYIHYFGTSIIYRTFLRDANIDAVAIRVLHQLKYTLLAENGLGVSISPSIAVLRLSVCKYDQLDKISPCFHRVVFRPFSARFEGTINGQHICGQIVGTGLCHFIMAWDINGDTKQGCRIFQDNYFCPNASGLWILPGSLVKIGSEADSFQKSKHKFGPKYIKFLVSVVRDHAAKLPPFEPVVDRSPDAEFIFEDVPSWDPVGV